MPAKRIKLTEVEAAVKSAVAKVSAAKKPSLSKSIKVPIINGIIVDDITLGGAKPVDIARRIQKELPAGLQGLVKPRVIGIGGGLHIVGLVPVMNQF